MGRFIDAILHTPRYARCDNCEEPIGERGRGSNQWLRGPRMNATDDEQPLGGRNDDGSINGTGDRCKGTDGGTGKHKPKDGSLW
jgi:hypothetical protein